jgi:hypothetical protein
LAGEGEEEAQQQQQQQQQQQWQMAGVVLGSGALLVVLEGRCQRQAAGS